MRWRSLEVTAETTTVSSSRIVEDDETTLNDPDMTSSASASLPEAASQMQAETTTLRASSGGASGGQQQLDCDNHAAESMPHLMSADQLLDQSQHQQEQQQSSYEDDNNTNHSTTGGAAGSRQEGLDASSSSSSQKLAEPPDKRILDQDEEHDDDGADHAEETLPTTWMPQNVQSTCEFTHTIDDYANKRESGCKKAEYSSTTVDEFGNRWRLIIYVNGNGRASNHHLSLFLQVADADDLPFGWKKSVSYVLTLEHPKGGSLSYAKRNPDKTFKLCPKAIDWGWSQFITSDRIQQEGFVSKDSLTVRASVTVKSSSVSIDEEDAELYLKCAAEEGDAEAVRLCLDHGASVNCKFKDDLYTPLHTACSSGTSTGSMQVLNLLLQEGADCNACNKWRETPLLIAANNGHRAAVEALLKHGANPSMCSEAGWSALTFAAHKGYDDIVALLLRAGAPVGCPVTEDSSTPLHKACAGSKSGHLASVKQLLKSGADVHALNKWRETPLLTAANHGQAGAVEALLTSGADPCMCTDTGWSPLSIAAYKGHDDVVRLLLEEGAPTEEDDPTLSALLQAATKGLPNTVELLLGHGADHTVTTKKGDTALSILVEQNLIDAAVEMVSTHNASIPRCSRDRKKVQRARLLINLRMKQLEKEGKKPAIQSDDEMTDDEDLEDNEPMEDEGSQSPAGGPKKGRGGKKNVSAEEKAKAAEEALLLELEQEDAKAKKSEAEANSKRAKKRKKKEQQRQLKLKEDEERRAQEIKEAEKRDRLKRAEEEKLRREREREREEEREREKRELVAREKVLAAKRKELKERETVERERLEKEQRVRDKAERDDRRRSDMTESPSAMEKRKTGKMMNNKKGSAFAVSPKPVRKGQVAPAPNNRRWETTAVGASVSPSRAQSTMHEAQVETTPIPPRPVPLPPVASPEIAPTTFHPPRSTGLENSSSSMMSAMSALTDDTRALHGSSQLNVFHQFGAGRLEHPAIALLRREKVVQMLQRCSQSQTVVDDTVIKRAIYRWLVRAAHADDPCLDSLIPSWTDSDKLTAFFQRQFIAESRRSGLNGGGPSIEALKDAGSSTAIICKSLARELSEFRQRIEDQLPEGWSDAALGMSISDGTLNGSGPLVTLAWSNRSSVVMPSASYTSLRDRYTGNTSQFLAAAFMAKVWFDTKQLIVSGTVLDCRLPAPTRVCLANEASVNAELWSDPFSVHGSNVYWGAFEHVDALFGGQKPFATGEQNSEGLLARRGGSIAVLAPLDNMVASRYVQNMVDMLDSASAANAPLSFAVFLHKESFHDVPNGPRAEDVQRLDLRLREDRCSYLRRVEVLPAGQHGFLCGDVGGSINTCPTSSLVVILQNHAAQTRYDLTDTAMARILASLSIAPPASLPVPPPIHFSSDHFNDAPPTPQPGFFRGISASTPDQLRAELGTIGGNPYSNSFSSGESIPRGSRRGRLFDLVDDDGEEDQSQDVDLVSGMLNSLDVGMFQNGGSIASDVDIEAISLMGIGGPPPSSSHSYNQKTWQ